MADKLSTFERRIEILFLLINSEKVTLSELSKRYSVHKNTVYNDIAFLGRYAPIRTESGVNGGIFIRENYHCDLFRYLCLIFLLLKRTTMLNAICFVRDVRILLVII